MHQDEQNEYGCPIRNQTGIATIKNFTALVEQLSPDLREAFEAERKERREEYDTYVAEYGYRT